MLHIQGVPPPQLNISAFAPMQSNGVADGTGDWETVEAEGLPAEDHLNNNASRTGIPSF